MQPVVRKNRIVAEPGDDETCLESLIPCHDNSRAIVPAVLLTQRDAGFYLQGKFVRSECVRSGKLVECSADHSRKFLSSEP